MTWGELVEARYLLGYRRDLLVSRASLRPFIAEVRKALNGPYPLAHERPRVGEGRRLLVRPNG
ncbi:MAG: hypothetical protein M3083_13320 [Actinomycetota bacterium]|nr:hypothetical protein [Actinomycetota bacterium]MDQ6947137.1 hypothetical protein [Actinomycetota bacterium]